jgi:hypothetical protein
MYRAWLAIGTAGLLGGVAVVSLFAGFGSPVFLGVAAVSAGGGLLAYRYGRERMLRSVYAGVATDRGRGGDDAGPDPGAQATDGGETTAERDGSTGYDDWTWAGRDPDDPFWSDDSEDWEDPWAWQATDPEEAAGDGDREAGWERTGAERDETGGWTGWSREGSPDDDTDDRERRGTETDAGDRPSIAEAYEALGLEPGADREAIREAYRERVKETHPDLGGDPEAFIRVRAAYERLRERFDRDE